MLTLSAPASITARASSSDRMPPPTASGMNSCLRDVADRVEQGAAAFERRRDVEHDQLVDAFGVVARGQLAGIAGVAQAREVDAFDDLAVADVEAGDERLGQHGSVRALLRTSARRKFASSRRPVAPDFSGWNCAPNDAIALDDRRERLRRASWWPSCRRATGAANEWVKYADGARRQAVEQARDRARRRRACSSRRAAP